MFNDVNKIIINCLKPDKNKFEQLFNNDFY